MIAVGDVHAAWATVKGCGRRCAAVSGELAVMVHSGGDLRRSLVNGILHLSQQMVDLDEIFLRPRIWHGQVVLLRQGILSWRRRSVDYAVAYSMAYRMAYRMAYSMAYSMAGRLGIVRLRGAHGPVGHG